MPKTVMSMRLLFIVGLCASIWLAGCTQNTNTDNTPTLDVNISRSGDQVVAEVDGTHIYLSDVKRSAVAKGLIPDESQLAPTDPVFQNQLDELIDQRLLALDALGQSLDKGDEAQRRLAASRELILSNIAIEHLLAEKVTDETLQRMYEEQAALRTDMKQVRARHILVETEEEAVEIADLLENGGDFATLAKLITLDESTQDLGGDLGFFTQSSMEAEIGRQAFALGRGEVSNPFETARGWHILKVEDMRATPQPTFDEIKAEITSFITFDEIDKKLKSLRKDSEIILKIQPSGIVQETDNGP